MLSFIQKRLRSFVFAFQGIGYLFRTQPNAWIHLLALTCATIAGFWFGIERSEWIAIIIVSTLVITMEAVNTALETLTNLASPDYHPLAGHAKDVAAAAVLISAFGSVATGIVIFGPRIIALWQ